MIPQVPHYYMEYGGLDAPSSKNMRRPPDGDFVGQPLLCVAARSAPHAFWSAIGNSGTQPR